MAGPESFVLPVITLAVALTPVLIRTVRQSFLETLGEDHVRAARARGIPERRVILVHGLKVAALPLVTLIGLQAGFIMAGSYVVELIFNWPGIGKLTLDAVTSRDFPMIQGCVLVAALVFVLVNFFVDLAYAALDPRIRHGRAADRHRHRRVLVGTGSPGRAARPAPAPARSPEGGARRADRLVIVLVSRSAPGIAPRTRSPRTSSAILAPPVWAGGCGDIPWAPTRWGGTWPAASPTELGTRSRSASPRCSARLLGLVAGSSPGSSAAGGMPS